MRAGWRGLGVGLMGVSLVSTVLAASCAEMPEDRARPELDGEAFGGFGGDYLGVGGLGGAGGASTTTTTTTTTGTGGGCDDFGVGEPNDSEAAAWYIGTIDDCDSHGKTLAAVLRPGEADWYRYKGTDASGCIVDPAASLTLAAGSARVCQYADCFSGATSVSCNGGSTAVTSGEGRPGCCHTQGFSMDIECPGINDDAYIYLRVDQATASCVDYVLAYHY